MPKDTFWAVLLRQEPGRRWEEHSTSNPSQEIWTRRRGSLFGFGFFLPLKLIFTGFFYLNMPWVPWILQRGPFLLAGGSSSAGRLALAIPWLVGSCCPSHPCRDLTFPQQLCHECFLHGEAQHRNRMGQHPHRSWGAAAPSLQFLDVLSGVNLQLESPLSNMAFYKNGKKTPEWWTPWSKVPFRSWEASRNSSPSLGSSSSIKPSAAQCKWLERPKFQGTMSCSCIFSTCCMSKGKKPSQSPAEQHWAMQLIL